MTTLIPPHYFPSDFSHNYNAYAYNVLQRMIKRKNNGEPFTVTEREIFKILTDMDHFPYQRFFRGVYNYHSPIVHSRYAGIVRNLQSK